MAQQEIKELTPEMMGLFAELIFASEIINHRYQQDRMNFDRYALDFAHLALESAEARLFAFGIEVRTAVPRLIYFKENGHMAPANYKDANAVDYCCFYNELETIMAHDYLEWYEDDGRIFPLLTPLDEFERNEKISNEIRRDLLRPAGQRHEADPANLLLS
ncbi:hypothetical protein MTBLM1_10312 [Rhodospirillaceae bacterium LM-1]|nr:hypothetical protein MTBLM1_10312 [Rhodospirillaceae bacterium LM-1]